MASNPSPQPTPQQQRVLIARQDHPDKTAAELGELLGISSGAVYQAEGRLREGGHLPSLRSRGRRKGKRGPGRPRKTTSVTKLAAVPDLGTTEPKTSAGSPSAPDAVEKMIAEELDGNQTRIQSIESQQAQLREEYESRVARQQRLKRAQEALVA